MKFVILTIKEIYKFKLFNCNFQPKFDKNRQDPPPCAARPKDSKSKKLKCLTQTVGSDNVGTFSAIWSWFQG